MSKSLSEIFAHLNSINAEVSLVRNTYRYSGDEERWYCNVQLSTTQTELKVRGHGTNADDATVMAYERLLPLLDSKAVTAALAIPLLTLDGETSE